MTVRLAFFTIGESPRSDVVPEMAAILGERCRIDEVGALDGLDQAARLAMAPRDGAYRFATRLRDGTAVQLDKAAAEARLAEVMRAADHQGYDALVPLCTGTAIPALSTLVIEPQQVIDHALVGLAAHCRRIGILVPLAAQVEHFHLAAPLPCATEIRHASPYDAPAEASGRLAQKASQLKHCDLIVMHCMGYRQWMRDIVARESGRPVLLSNKMVANTLSQLFEEPMAAA